MKNISKPLVYALLECLQILLVLKLLRNFRLFQKFLMNGVSKLPHTFGALA